ncbi:hypothetical protein APR08_004463 [Nocardia amikacinitolerans]|nr:hypothetical protein [Nocardia amikacinitolerans]
MPQAHLYFLEPPDVGLFEPIRVAEAQEVAGVERDGEQVVVESRVGAIPTVTRLEVVEELARRRLPELVRADGIGPPDLSRGAGQLRSSSGAGRLGVDRVDAIVRTHGVDSAPRHRQTSNPGSARHRGTRRPDAPAVAQGCGDQIPSTGAQQPVPTLRGIGRSYSAAASPKPAARLAAGRARCGVFGRARGHVAPRISRRRSPAYLVAISVSLALCLWKTGGWSCHQ